MTNSSASALMRASAASGVDMPAMPVYPVPPYEKINHFDFSDGVSDLVVDMLRKWAKEESERLICGVLHDGLKLEALCWRAMADFMTEKAQAA